jgi:hypothetical protein
MAVALTALVVAMGGTAGATGVIGGKSDPSAAAAKKKKSSGKRGPRGPRGPAGPQGPQGAPGGAGAPGANGTAVAYAEVVTDSSPPQFADNHGFPGGPTARATGVFCLPIPSGATLETPLSLSLAGGSAGFVTQVAGSPDCGGSYEIKTGDVNANLTNHVYFNVVVP